MEHLYRLWAGIHDNASLDGFYAQFQYVSVYNYSGVSIDNVCV